MSIGEIGLRIGRITCSVWIAKTWLRIWWPWDKKNMPESLTLIVAQDCIVVCTTWLGITFERTYRVEHLSATLRAAFNDKTNVF